MTDAARLRLPPALLQVDLTSLPAADQIGTATLRLYGAAGALTTAGTLASQAAVAAPVSVSAFAAAQTDWFWNEFDLNWTTRPTPTGSVVVTKSVGGQNWHEFDIAPILRAQKAAGAKSAAIALRGTTVGTTSAVFASDESGANRPQLVVTKVTPVVPPPTTSVVLQAESATFGGGTIANAGNRNYTGSGYADFAGAGSWAQLAVDRPAAGAATLAVRYANGSAANRPYHVVVNGVTVGQHVVDAVAGDDGRPAAGRQQHGPPRGRRGGRGPRPADGRGELTGVRCAGNGSLRRDAQRGRAIRRLPRSPCEAGLNVTDRRE
jgi:hypothetical protein